ncbi:MAG TPA: polysaccharide biosynthesis tyrosine autokinase [Chloroflexota bacterium]|nr:polysaccharide biosynthesis tyrosine autokinase [Chloroflexota bacterium]
MSIGLFLHHARRWVAFAIIPAVVLALLAYLYEDSVPKTYQATAVLFVQESSTAIGTGGIQPTTQDSEQLAAAYTQLINAPVIINNVQHLLASRYHGFKVSHDQITAASSQSSTAQQNGLQISISAVDTNPGRAEAVANAVGYQFVSHINFLTASRYQRDISAAERQLHGQESALRFAGAGQRPFIQQNITTLQTTIADLKVVRDASQTVSMYSAAPKPSLPIGPHPARTSLLVGFVVLLLCGAGIFLYDYFDDSIRTPEEAEELVGAPVLGTIQKFDPARTGGQLITEKQPRSVISEAYRLVRTNIQFTNVDRPPRTLVVTSSRPKEGKSTTAGNLAHVFADAGNRVTLVDADLRRPSLHKIFAIAGREGLTSLLVSNEMNGHHGHETSQPNLRVIASGPIPPNPTDLLGSHRMQALIDDEQQESGVVIIDSPPVLAVADAAVLSTMADGVVLVVDPSETKRRELRRSREAIEAVGGKIIGLIINRLTPHGSGYYYYYHYQHYGYGYGYEYSSDRKRDKPSSDAERAKVGSAS